MNLAQSYNYDGTRVDCAVLYSPFLRMLLEPMDWKPSAGAERPALHGKAPQGTRILLKHQILDALNAGACSAGELWKRCALPVERKPSFSDAIRRLVSDGLIERYGSEQPYAYGKKQK